MPFLPRWLFIGVLSLLATQANAMPPAPLPAERLWQQGQEAMKQGELDRAEQCYQQSLSLDPKLTRNYLSLAVVHVGRGEDAKAVPWLALYLQAQPDHYVVRLHYAELLLRLGRAPQARTQMERFIADVQDRPELASEHLLDCHVKLCELAEATNDVYAEHLNRGIGLYLLARRRAEVTDDIDGPTAEALYCKAAAELTLARLCAPREARPHWYLHEVWSHLVQSQPAGCSLRAAEEAAPFTFLTPAERRELTLACRMRGQQSTHK